MPSETTCEDFLKMAFEVGYIVADAAAAAEFYVSAFHCVELVRMEMPIEITGPTGMGEPGLLIALRTPDGHVVKFLDCQGGFGIAASASQQHDHYLTFWVDDLDEVSEACAKAGGHPLTDKATDLPMGGRMRFFADPSGNAIELIEGKPPF
jgi:catechol 2,3-dioxygenase-like lactoylglutathione lyase family enzyme